MSGEGERVPYLTFTIAGELVSCAPNRAEFLGSDAVPYFECLIKEAEGAGINLKDYDFSVYMTIKKRER